MANRKTEPAPLKFPARGELATHFKRFVKIATRLPGVDESRSYGTPSVKVKGKFMARLRTEAEGGLAIRCEFLDRYMLMQADPETFYITDHYQDSPMILIDLTRVRWDAMPGICEQAWLLSATASVIKAYQAQQT